MYMMYRVDLSRQLSNNVPTRCGVNMAVLTYCNVGLTREDRRAGPSS